MNSLALSINDAVKLSGIGRTKLYELIKTGELAKRKLGRKTLIIADELKAYLDALPKV